MTGEVSGVVQRISAPLPPPPRKKFASVSKFLLGSEIVCDDCSLILEVIGDVASLVFRYQVGWSRARFALRQRAPTQQHHQVPDCC